MTSLLAGGTARDALASAPERHFVKGEVSLPNYTATIGKSPEIAGNGPCRFIALLANYSAVS
ncbi:MAG: hypothetical protein NT069_18635 [Planctomycetota bacterium]|nr:hypothetical protein [Planctomycetota bacterium]